MRKKASTDILNQDTIKFHPSSKPIFHYAGLWQLTCCHSVSQSLFRLFPMQDPLKVSS